MGSKKDKEEAMSGAVRDIMDAGLRPLRCVCKSTSFMFASSPDGSSCKLYCPCCGTFSSALVPLRESKLLTNMDPEAAELGLSDEEMEQVRKWESESDGDADEEDWGNKVTSRTYKKGNTNLN